MAQKKLVCVPCANCRSFIGAEGVAYAQTVALCRCPPDARAPAPDLCMLPGSVPFLDIWPPPAR